MDSTLTIQRLPVLVVTKIKFLQKKKIDTFMSKLLSLVFGFEISKIFYKNLLFTILKLLLILREFAPVMGWLSHTIHIYSRIFR